MFQPQAKQQVAPVIGPQTENSRTSLHQKKQNNIILNDKQQPGKKAALALLELSLRWVEHLVQHMATPVFLKLACLFEVLDGSHPIPVLELRANSPQEKGPPPQPHTVASQACLVRIQERAFCMGAPKI